MRDKKKWAEYMRKYYSDPTRRQKKRYKDKEYGRIHSKKIIEKVTEWAKNHKEYRKEYLKNYYQKNKEKLDNANRKYELKHKKQLSEAKNLRNKERRKIDINFKMRMILRRSIYGYLKGRQKGGSAVRDLGCTISELKIYLEKQWKEGMTWDNWAKRGWHIDHIKPLSRFDLTDRKQFLEACHYTNLQPLWWRDNIIKSNKSMV